MKLILTTTLAAVALTGAATVAPAAAEAFTGHGCRITSCRYFTSGNRATYYYDRHNCDQWKGLSRTALQGFATKRALLHAYPGRRLHAAC